MTSESTSKVKENNINSASSTNSSAKKHIKPSILSATLLSLADAVGAVGGGFSAGECLSFMYICDVLFFALQPFYSCAHIILQSFIYSIYTSFSCYMLTAIAMAQKATGLSTVDAAYSTSLGLLPLCLGYTIYGLLEDYAKENNSSDDDDKTNNNSDMMLNSQVYWPGALAFATTATIVGKGSRLLIGFMVTITHWGQIRC